MTDSLYPKITLADIFGLAQTLITSASTKSLTVGTAESCTGGLLGAAITSIPGSSAVFQGGFMTYSNTLKTEFLGVPAALIAEYGAVSPEVCQAMAKNARERLGVDIAVSITGIAGPGGGSSEKPVGTVYIGFASEAGVTIDHHVFTDMRRNKVRDYSVYEGLKGLITRVENLS